MSERVSVGSWPRRTLAGWLRRLADRLAPQRELRVNVIADTTGFDEACRDVAAKLRRLNHYAGYVGPDVKPSESGVAVTFESGLPRRRG